MFIFSCMKSKVVFFGREPPSGESTSIILWGQLSTTCSNVTEVAQWAAPSCSWPQPATDNGVRDVRSDFLAVTLHLSQGSTLSVPLTHSTYKSMQPLFCRDSNFCLLHVRQPPFLCGRSGYKVLNIQINTTIHSHFSLETLSNYTSSSVVLQSVLGQNVLRIASAICSWLLSTAVWKMPSCYSSND